MEKKDLVKFLLVLNVPLFFLVTLATFFVIAGGVHFHIGLVVIFALLFCMAYFFLSYAVLVMWQKSIRILMSRLSDLSTGNVFISHESKTSFFKNTLLHDVIDGITQNMKSIWKYLDEITKGSFENKYSLIAENDEIGQKLNELTESLLRNKKAIEQAKADDERRNWTAQGLTRFNDLIRQEHKGIEEKGYDLISNLVDYVGFTQGGLFVLNEDNSQDIYFEMVAAIAYNRPKIIDSKVRYGESLVGRCAHEKMTIYLTEIPDNYLSITSGLGESNPRCLLLVPCILDQTVYGVIEIASFNPVESYKLEFIEKLGENIASSIANMRTQEKTQALLEASKYQADELAAQEEELRQNLEEMETTQEDLKRQMELNLEMRKELAYEKFLFDSLLEKVPARVFFKDKESKFIKLSQSMVNKFGKNNYKEMIGMADADFFEPEFAQKTRNDELKIMDSRQGMLNFIENEKLADGREIWKTVSKIPLIDENDQCIGLFGIISDITDFKRAEIQSLLYKTNFDLLFEIINHRYCVIVLNEKGKIKTLNKNANNYFGISKAEYQDKTIDAFLDKYRIDDPIILPLIPEILSGKITKTSVRYKITDKTELFTEHFIVLELPDSKKEIIMVRVALNDEN